MSKKSFKKLFLQSIEKILEILLQILSNKFLSAHPGTRLSDLRTTKYGLNCIAVIKSKNVRMKQMIKCQTCGAQNLDQSQYCDECGAALIKGKDKKEESREMLGFQTRMSDAPVFQSSNATSVGIPPIAAINDTEKSSEKNGNLPNKSVHATLFVERGNSSGKEFPISADESLIGRWDADNGIFPDVDLDRHDPEAKVSRRHARILHNDGQYSIEDLGSTNGTFVNRGRRLVPGNAHLLSDGDEIIVGKTFLRLIISQ